MKKWLFSLLLVPYFLFGESSSAFYMGEMKSQFPDEEEGEHYGFFLLKRTFYPEENRFVDACYLKARDGEILEMEQESKLTGDLHEITFQSEEGMITGTGELIGFPWEWTHLKERMVIHSGSPIEVDVSNDIDGEIIISTASVYTVEEDGSREFFGTFRARLFKFDQAPIQKFLER
jgi:hypothetical protein